jgi:type IX secretion system PorP/SprF family membrane protein
MKKNYMKKNTAITLLLIARFNLIYTFSMGQDIHFSQFFEASLLRNPSLAGIYTGDMRMQAVYRDQWNSVTQAYKTASLNAEYKTSIGKADDFITLGLQMHYDRAGTVGLTTMHLLPVLNYHKSLSSIRNSYLSLGFMGGMVQRMIDRAKMTTNMQYDGLGDGETFPSNQYTYLDGSLGMSFNTNISNDPADNMFIGAAYHHFNRPKNSFFRDPSLELNPKLVFSAGIRFGVTDYSYLTIQADHSRQGSFMESVGGALYGVKLGENPDKPLYTVHAGGFLRWNDAFIPVIKLDYNPFSIALSYDINISKLKPSSYGRGGFELSVSYIGFLNRDNSSINAVLCPRF